MGFTIKEINQDRLQTLIEKNIWREECPVYYSRLRITELLYIDFEGEQKSGELIVLDKVAEGVIQVFKELLELRFPIEKMIPMEEFKGDDVKSMRANNSSGFNGRKVARTNRWSSHAYGCAIDINPIQNPYLLLDGERKLIEVIPPEGKTYLDRSDQQTGMVEAIVPIFARHGFSDWGGDWEAKPDYHHFQLPWEEIHKLVDEH